MSTTETTEVDPPDFLVPGVRCGLEVALVVLLILSVGLPTGNPLLLGLVVTSAVVAGTVVLFWALNRQMELWIVRARRTPRATGEPGAGD